MNRNWGLVVAILLGCELVDTASAQSQPVRLTGNVRLSTEFYSADGIANRRPSSISRFVFTPVVTIYDQVRLPFEIYITTEDRGFRQPFNQLGVSPQLFGWLTLHGGYYSARISDLTFGDTRLLGAGVEMRPGNFRFSLLYGRSQQAIAADTVAGVRGAYERRVLAARIGYGDENASFIDLNFVHAEDDSSSHQMPSYGIASDSVASLYDLSPKENAVLSLAYGIALFDNIVRLKGETSVAAFSNDTRSDQLDDPGVDIPAIFTPRVSSQVDMATVLSLNIVPSRIFSVALTGRWVGPGYVTLGYAQLPNDVLETTIAPRLRLFDGRLNVRASLGLRYNNLRDNRLATTQRTIGNIFVTYQATPMLGIDLQYSNYGMRSNPRNDTLRIDNISRSVTISPRYTFQWLGGTNSAIVTYSYQDFTDFNTVTGAINGNITETGSVIWTLAFPSSLSLTTSLLYTSSVTPLVKTIVRSFAETVGYAFFGGRLSTSFTLGYNVVSLTSSDGQLTGRLSASYSTTGYGTFTFVLSTNRYDYGDALVGSSYSELQGSLQYSFSF